MADKLASPLDARELQADTGRTSHHRSVSAPRRDHQIPALIAAYERARG